MELSKEEALQILQHFSHITVAELQGNVPTAKLVNKLITFVNRPVKVKPCKMLNVSFDIGTDNKIAAIKLYRNITSVGLKDAKDAVERAWLHGSAVPVGELSLEALERVKVSIAVDSWLHGGPIKWIVEEKN